jgi:dCTP deaminase
VLLSDRDIVARVDSGSLVIQPFDPFMVQPSSYDVRLGGSFRMFNPAYSEVDPAQIPDDLFVEVQEPPFDSKKVKLFPGEFVLACTAEAISVPVDLAAVVEGKSTLGRLGLQVHATAGFIDPGFSGAVTLEVSNVGPMPILLTPGMPIAQLCFMPMSGPVNRPYGHPDLGSRYQGQSGAQPPRAVRKSP